VLDILLSVRIRNTSILFFSIQLYACKSFSYEWQRHFCMNECLCWDSVWVMINCIARRWEVFRNSLKGTRIMLFYTMKELGWNETKSYISFKALEIWGKIYLPAKGNHEQHEFVFRTFKTTGVGVRRGITNCPCFVCAWFGGKHP